MPFQDEVDPNVIPLTAWAMGLSAAVIVPALVITLLLAERAPLCLELDCPAIAMISSSELSTGN